MEQTFVRIYIVVSVIMAALDLFVAGKAYHQTKKSGKYLAGVAVAAAAVDLSYLASVLCRPVFYVSLSSSIYFISIDVMLIFFTLFCDSFTRIRFAERHPPVLKLVCAYAALETVLFLLNPFLEISLGYIQRNDIFSRYAYDMHFPYYCHLAFSYALLVLSVGMIIYRHCHMPRLFRKQYVYIEGIVAVLVIVNGIFLFISGEHVYNLIDYSILGYSFVLLIMYWSCFSYSRDQMLKNLSLEIFDDIGQGIMFFDQDGCLLMNNSMAKSMFPHTEMKEELALSDFITGNSIPLDLDGEKLDTSVQCTLSEQSDGSDQSYAARLEYHRMLDHAGRNLGSLLIFTDTRYVTDLLTGFYTWDNFLKTKKDDAYLYQNMHTTAFFDINHLEMINQTGGQEAGDAVIRQLADQIRRIMPSDSVFIRGQDAHLIVLSSVEEESRIAELARNVKEELPFSVEAGVSSVNKQNHNLTDAIRLAEFSMQNKKLLNQESSHSQLLTSLVRALHECDPNTEAHVQRTRLNGKKLAERMGLSDMEKSDLSLLCLLHDIGKIGIPLEILNKPGKLSEDEWAVLRSHVEKGYQIAKSTKELEGIADMILHHHERWDGLGYPDGLSRESIPLLSRIIAVVDSFDAMIYDRSYREALTIDQALEELRKNAGTQFDPSIVAELIQMIEEDQAMQNRRQNEQSEMPEGDSAEEEPATHLSLESSEESPALSSIYEVHYSRYFLNAENIIISADDHFEEMTGYTKEDISTGELTQWELIPEEDIDAYMNAVAKHMKNDGHVYIEHRLRRKDGSIRYVFCFGKPYFDSAVNEIRNEILITENASSHAIKALRENERMRSKEQQEHWENIYRRDSLTGLMNHAAFQHDVEMYLLAREFQVVLLMFDVDHFKEYNDTYGHDAGDEYLKLIARTLSTSLRSGDLSCRMGGDEFAAALFFPKESSADTIRSRAEQIRTMICTELEKLEGHRGVSMGAAISDDTLTSFRLLYQEADQALYYSKNHGRNCMTMALDIRKGGTEL